jgi:hypothetical protein
MVSRNHDEGLYREVRRPEQQILQIASAAPGWWAQFSGGQLEPVAVWALVEDREGAPLRLLGAYLGEDEFVTTADCEDFESFVFDPRPDTLQRWLSGAGS